MKTPEVQIVIDKEWDKEVFVYFLDEKDLEYDFGKERILSLHPNIDRVRGKSVEEKKTIINPYVDAYYRTHVDVIENRKKEMSLLWSSIEAQYFTEISKIFGNLDFYKSTGIKVALSITKAGVIGEDNSSFQIWYETIKEEAEVRRHFCHEILHFFYHSYLEQKGMNKLKEDWDLSEIFNVVILGLPQFVKFIGKEDLGYKQHEKYFSYYKKLWKECSDLDKYLKRTEGGLVSMSDH